MTAKIMPFRDADANPPIDLANGVRIHLGCNKHPLEGFINVDIVPFEGVDVVADLEKPWPWPDNHADLIKCADLPEHIRMVWESPDHAAVADAIMLMGPKIGDSLDKRVLDLESAVRRLIDAMIKPVRTYGIIHFMNEAHRVLKPGGILDMLIPSTDARGWSQDPTHVSHWNENSLLYYTNETYYGLYPHLIKARFKPVKVVTTVKNALDISWVHAILEKV